MANEKNEILLKYEEEARSLDNQDWLQRGNEIRVPEGEAAHYFVARKVSMALKMRPHQRDWDAHEIGCSFGQMTALLCREYDAITASDLSPSSVGLARKRFDYYNLNNVDFMVADVENMTNIANCQFDIIYTFSTVRFCNNRDVAMKEIYRTLRPGGWVVIDFPNRWSPWHFAIKPLLGIRKHVHDHLFSRNEAMELVKNAGFIIDGIEQFLFTSRRTPGYLLPFFKVFDRIFEGTFLRRFAGIIMISARRP